MAAGSDTDCNSKSGDTLPACCSTCLLHKDDLKCACCFMSASHVLRMCLLPHTPVAQDDLIGACCLMYFMSASYVLCMRLLPHMPVAQDDLMDSPEVEQMLKSAAHLKVRVGQQVSLPDPAHSCAASYVVVERQQVVPAVGLSAPCTSSSCGSCVCAVRQSVQHSAILVTSWCAVRF